MICLKGKNKDSDGCNIKELIKGCSFLCEGLYLSSSSSRRTIFLLRAWISPSAIEYAFSFSSSKQQNICIPEYLQNIIV